jgi:heme transport system ATP-binding protein
MTPVLVAENAGVQAGSRWLAQDISLQISSGEIVALVGPNGAGKSTLLAALAGDIDLASGRILLDGRDITTYRPRELAVRRAVLPQQTIIQFAFTAREIVEMGRSALDGDDIDDAVIDRVMRDTDSLEIAHRIFPTLSVGEQARVSLARVLAQETPLLLLDEPTAALDLRHQQMIMELARALADQGAAIAIILHDLNLASAFADAVVLMKAGRVMAIGSPEATLTESLLSGVFDCHVSVMRHPDTGGPLILPIASRIPLLL